MRFVRWLPQDTVWLVTNRCEREQFLLKPCPEMNDLIGAWLARALEKYGDGIELYAFIFLSNHFHLLLADSKGQLPKVMWYFQTNLAKAINELYDRSPAHVFGRRYDAERVEGTPRFLERYAYVLGNPVKSGAVRRAAWWPGLSSLHATLSDQPMTFRMRDRTAFHNASRGSTPPRPQAFERTHTLRLAVPPMLLHLSPEKRWAATEEIVAAFELQHHQLRADEGKGFLGVRGVLALEPTDRPAQPSFGRSRRVAADTPEREREIVGAWKWVTNDYRERFAGFRQASLLGRRFHGRWPPWTCPPGCHEPVTDNDR